ncbi:hypothetical protein DXG03_008544, partial [Asterophora parasitica]
SRTRRATRERPDTPHGPFPDDLLPQPTRGNRLPAGALSAGRAPLDPSRSACAAAPAPSPRCRGG